MEGYTYPEPAYPGPADRYPEPDGYEYYDMVPMGEDHGDGRRKERPGRSKHSPNRQKRKEKRSHSKSSRSRSGSQSTSLSRSNVSGSRNNLKLRESSFMDAFKVVCLTPSKHKKNTAKFLATKKREDHIEEVLKADRLGSKRWLFYPRAQTNTPVEDDAESKESCDQRIKVDGDFFRKYKKAKKVDPDAPIAKLKRWELILYKKLGFVQAV